MTSDPVLNSYRSKADTANAFWTLIATSKAGSAGSAGSKGSAGSAGSGVTASLTEQLNAVMEPGGSDTFQIVFPQYISMYALAKYKTPSVARYALLNYFDSMQAELSTEVEQNQAQRNNFATNPQQASCDALNTLTMQMYGQLLSVYSTAEDLSGQEVLAEALDSENLKLQGMSACMNQGATPSAACIALATQDEKLFPLLPMYDSSNIDLLTQAQSLQAIINSLLQAYTGMTCSLPTGGSGALTIASVFSQDYINNLPIVDTESLKTSLQNLSPYYVSSKIVNYISGQLIGTDEFNSELADSNDIIKNMSKTTNSIVSLTSNLDAGQFFNETPSDSSPIGFAQCPPGYRCPPTATMPILCSAGTYCPAGTTDTPLKCDPGTYSPEGASMKTQCVRSVPPGYYVDKGQVVKCPTGSYCPGGTAVAAETCPPGTFNMKTGMIGLAACLPCPVGSYCSSSASVTPCPTGTYNPERNKKAKSDCLAAPAGSYCGQKGMSQAKPCPPGSYSSGTGASSCTAVPVGYSMSAQGQTRNNSTICPAGTFCTGGNATPQLCPPGSYCPTPGLSAAILCPVGTYGATSGLTTSRCSGQCPAGYYCQAGSINPTITPCPGGSICPIGTEVPVPCPTGHYCPPGSTAAVPCPVGTYNPVAEKSGPSACLPCMGANPNIGQTCPPGCSTPVLCPIGYYCPPINDTNQPILCPVGNICDRPGLASPNYCPPGYNCPVSGLDGSSKPATRCPVGTYSSGGAGSMCTPCPPGQLCDTSALGSPPHNQCPAGTYSTGGAGSSCMNCPPGTYGTGSSDSSSCSGICPAGYYCPAGTASATPPTLCPAGYACPPGTGTFCPAPQTLVNGQCQCPASTYFSGSSTVLGSSRTTFSSVCTQCTKGTRASDCIGVQNSISVTPPSTSTTTTFTLPYVVRTGTPFTVSSTAVSTGFATWSMNGAVNSGCTSESTCTFTAPTPGTTTITLAVRGQKTLLPVNLTDTFNPVTISVI